MQHVRELFHLPQSKELVNIPKQPVKDGHYWFQLMLAKMKKMKKDTLVCPWEGCTGDLLKGPSGGMSINMKCNECDRKWNYTEILQKLDRI